MRICKYTNRTNFYLTANKHLQGRTLARGIQDAALKAGLLFGLQALQQGGPDSPHPTTRFRVVHRSAAGREAS